MEIRDYGPKEYLGLENQQGRGYEKFLLLAVIQFQEFNF